MNKKYLAVFAAIITTLIFSVITYADDAHVELDSITVTAEKREGEAREVPASLTVLSDVQLEDAGVVDTEGLINEVPNMHMIDAGNHSSAGFFSLRGITPVMEGEQSVGFFVDDVYHSTFDAGLFDVERIEVLKGPQGTLYGRNTLAGVVNVLTKSPTQDWQGEASLSAGELNSLALQAVVSGPLLENKLLMRLAVRKATSDGGFKNQLTGNDKSDERDDMSVRGKLKWLLNERSQVELSHELQHGRNGNASFKIIGTGADDPHQVNMDYEGFADLDASATKLRLNYSGDGYEFTSITAHTDEQIVDSIDLDFSTLDFMRLDTDVAVDRVSQEVRLLSNNDTGIEWLAGVYLFQEKSATEFFVDMRQGVPEYGLPPFKDITESQTDSDGYALFGQLGYQITDRLKLSAGLRYDYESKDFEIKQFTDPVLGDTVSLEDDADFDSWLPKLALAYEVSPFLNTYATIARGYKSGGFNRLASIDNPNIDIFFEPEFTWNYEVGFKSSWLNNRLDITGALFHIDWSDQQIEQQFYPQSVTTNAGESTSQGLELELTAKASSNLQLSAGLGYTHAKFDSYRDDLVDTVSGEVIGVADYSGNRTPYVPQVTYNLAADLQIDANWFARLGLRGNGDYYHDVQNTIKEEAYQIVNARLGYEKEQFQLYLWAKNLLDEEYGVRAFDFPGLGTISRAGAPRTLGVTLKSNW